MGLLGIFGGRAPRDLEKKGDALCEKREYGLAKLEYERALERCRKKGQGDEALEARLLEKANRSREALARTHREEGLEIMESGYGEAAADCFRLALDLTRDESMIADLRSLLEKLKELDSLEGEDELDADLFEPDVENEFGVSQDTHELFTALVSSLPPSVRQAFSEYGPSFGEGYVALHQGDFETAVERFTRCLEEDPGRKLILPELATACLNLGRVDEAGEKAEEFMALNVEELHTYPGICEVLWAAGDYDRALAWLETVPENMKESLPIILLRAETHFRAKNPAEAEGILKEAMDLYGFHPEAAKQLAAVHEARGRKEKARDLYGEVLNACRTCSTPPDPWAKKKFADLSYELGDRSNKVLELYLSLAREQPSSRAEFFEKISRIYESQGNRTEAERFMAFSRQTANETSDPGAGSASPQEAR